METYPFFTKKRGLLPIQGTLLKRRRQEADRYIAYYDMAGLSPPLSKYSNPWHTSDAKR
jgi:hypothetical protein